MLLLVARANETGAPLFIPAAALAQSWRDGQVQVQLSRLLKSPVSEVVNLDEVTAREAGQWCGATGTTDVVDASVVLCAQSRSRRVVTSDPDDLRRLDRSLELIVV